MKIAILMHGITGATDKFGTGTNVPVHLSHEHFKKHILDANKEHDVDVFVHSWSTEAKEELLELYNPVDHLIEPQLFLILSIQLAILTEKEIQMMSLACLIEQTLGIILELIEGWTI